MFDVAYWLLDSPFLSVGRGPDEQTFKVNNGTGIGLTHSGDVADAAFYPLVERDLLMCNAFAAASVLDWYRFKDDMLFLVQDAQAFKSLWGTMREQASFYDIVIEEVSLVSLRFLDVMVSRSGDRIVTTPALKDPCLCRRLARTSAHHWSIHTSWPRMMMRRLEKLASDPDDVCAYKAELSTRLRKDNCIVPNWSSGERRGAKPRPVDWTLWLPLPYTPWSARSLTKSLRRFGRDESYRALLLSVKPSWEQFGIRIAWRNVLPSTQSLLLYS